MLSEITFGATQQTLFHSRNPQRDKRLMHAMDQINIKMGSGTLHPAASGLARRRWAMAQRFRSPRYTTRWDELPRTQ